MAERFVNNLIGSDGGAGTELDPWFTVPGMTGANAVTAGDIINVRNGTVQVGRLSVPANNLTYRGYGLAQNVLYLTLPARDVRFTKTVRVVREPGVHEGMWILDGTTVDHDGELQNGNRPGVVVEDVQVIGSRIGARHSIGIGFSTSAETDVALRRFEVRGASGRGINVMTKGVTVEWGRVDHVLDDCITVFATADNGSRAGATDTFRYLELREPNFLAPGEPESGATGDCFQCIAYEAGGNYAFESRLVMHDINCHKSSTAKQLFLFHDALGGMTVRRWRATGGGEKATIIGPLRGSLQISDFYIEDPCPSTTESLPTFRWERPNTGAPAWAMATGSSLRIERGVTTGNHAGLYSTISAEGASEYDGSVAIRDVTVTGRNVNALSWQAELALYASTSLSTFGANASFDFSGLAFLGTPPTANVRLPVGVANNANYKVRGCRFSDAPYNIGASSYATPALFHAAHSGATDNSEGDPMVTAQGVPLPGSPLLTQGADLGPRRDIRGFQGRKFIGAYGPARLVAE